MQDTILILLELQEYDYHLLCRIHTHQSHHSKLKFLIHLQIHLKMYNLFRGLIVRCCGTRILPV